jgi:hypothetical protein
MSQYDIDGHLTKRVSRVVTFADEIKPSAESPWAYISVLSVPWEKVGGALERLMEDRLAAKYDYELKWKNLSKRQLHASPGATEQLARAWLTRLVNEHDLWRFSITGIDTSRLVMSQFGDKKGDQIANSYRRFYRATLKRHVSSLHWHSDVVVVERCYHDEEGRLETDEWFASHPIAIVGARDTVTFKEEQIRFVSSCHRKGGNHQKASHFIQLVDILGGAPRYVLEAVGRNHARDSVVQPFIPLLERINDPKRAGNVRSSYKHVGRASISYFPSREITEADLEDEFLRAQSSFYIGRELKLVQEQSGQIALDMWACELNRGRPLSIPAWLAQCGRARSGLSTSFSRRVLQVDSPERSRRLVQ